MSQFVKNDDYTPKNKVSQKMAHQSSFIEILISV